MSPTLSSPTTLNQKQKKFSLPRKIPLLLLIIGLLIYYRSLIEFTYKVNNTLPTEVPVNNNNETYKDGEDLNAERIFSTKEHRYKFRVNRDELKRKYQVSDIIRIVIEPRNPSLVGKLDSTFFRVQVTGTTTFSPQLVSSPNSSVLVYEAPLLDPGKFKLQTRIMFYDFPGIYSTNKIPRIPKLDQIILNGEFEFEVEQSPEWDRLKPQLPNTCADIPTIRGRWKKDFSQFIPYNCIVPKYELPEILESNEVKDPVPVNLNNLPYKYTWIRLMGDSNSRALFSRVQHFMGARCNWNSDGQNKDKKTQAVCKLEYKRTKFFGDEDPRPREVYITYEWFYPGSRYSLETLLNSTFKQVSLPFKKKGPCYENPENNICSVKRADYTFVSLGSHTPEWNDKQTNRYLDKIFQYVHKNYREKLTFITTNAANIGKIPPRKAFLGQYAVRNNYRIAKSNELLKNHVDKSQEEGYNNIDLLDFFGITQPIWEFSRDAVHYDHPVYVQQMLLIADKLVDYLRAIVI